MTKRKKILLTTATGILLVAVAFLFYTFNPEKYAFFPKCPSLLLTGYQCPGCGSQRAIHDLLRLRIGEAFTHNLLVPIAIPYILLGIYLQYFGGKQKFPKVERILFGQWAAIAMLIIVISYWVLRNL